MITDICVMHILVTAATTLEIQPTIQFLEQQGSRLAGHEIRLLTTGVGQVATLYSLLKQRSDPSPNLVIQAGIAGCFTGKQAGETVVVKEEMLDLGVWEEGRFRNIFDLGLANPDAFPFTSGLLVNPYQQLMNLSNVQQVRGISVNEITTDPSRIGWLQQNLSPVVESMEGGAFHYSCLQEGLPFLQIRSISNAIGIRDKTKWDIPAAIKGLNERLIGLLTQLSRENESILEISV